MFQRGLIGMDSLLAWGLLPSLKLAEVSPWRHPDRMKSGDTLKVDPALDGFKKTFSRFRASNQFHQKNETKGPEVGGGSDRSGSGENGHGDIPRGGCCGFSRNPV